MHVFISIHVSLVFLVVILQLQTLKTRRVKLFFSLPDRQSGLKPGCSFSFQCFRVTLLLVDVGMYVHACVHACGGQRQMPVSSSVTFYRIFFFFFQQGLSLNLVLPDSGEGGGGWLTSKTHGSCPTSAGISKPMPLHRAFTSVPGSELGLVVMWQALY